MWIEGIGLNKVHNTLAMDLLLKMLCYEAEDRIKVTEALSHPYLSGNGDEVMWTEPEEIFDVNEEDIEEDEDDEEE